jgi:UDP-3-O-[3-hydroxymyristoyl] glucosamine N-acyltransferase
LADLVQGVLSGDPDTPIANARTLAEAQPGDITFVENDKHIQELAKSQASAAVVPASVSIGGRPVIQVKDPLAAFIAIVRHLHARPDEAVHGIDPRAAIHMTAHLGTNCNIHAFVTIGARSVLGDRCRIYPGCCIGRYCRLGDDVTLYPNAVLYDGTILGDRVTIHANAVLGADGFGYRLHDGKHVKVPQLGHVEIGDDVEIGACTTIDRGTFQATRVGEGTKIDNLVQVGHNCQVGRHNLFVSQMGIAGSSTTGDHVVVAGQVGIADHVHIGDRAVLGAKAGVPQDVPAGESVLGAPARPARDQKRILLTLDKLPEMRRDLQRIKHHLGMDDEERALKLEDRGSKIDDRKSGTDDGEPKRQAG